MTTVEWTTDILGEGYEQTRFDLGDDPEGEGRVEAVLVRRVVRPGETVRGVALYVHGFSDYFFQTGLADFAAAHGLAFFALDLRKSGRARRPGQTAHSVTDLVRYDEELDRALAAVTGLHPDLPVVAVAHSTGGLILPLWLDRRRRAGTTAPVHGLVLNSPWFDLQGSSFQREVLTPLLQGLARVQPGRTVSNLPGVYGETLHTSGRGEWDFDLELKPLAGFPVTVGWLNAIRRGHARLHRGLDVGVPSLILRSRESHFSSEWSEHSDRADIVLDVRQIARWAGCLGDETTVVPVDGARHDVWLSVPTVRERAYAVTADWLSRHGFPAGDPGPRTV